MVTRRLFLFGTAAGVAAFATRRSMTAAASQPATRVGFDVPAGACDCHTHIFGDPVRFPFWSGRTYTPEPASIAEMRSLHRALHMDRVVIVHPSVYGTDNACTLDAIRQLGSRARGVAVVDEQTPARELDSMHKAGIRGIRLNLETFGQADPAAARTRLRSAIQQLGARPWHIQLFTRLSIVDALHDDFMSAPLPIVFDHFGGAQAALGVGQPGFAKLVDLVRSGRAYVKISAAYRSSTQAPDYGDVTPLAQALVTANPQRVIWGTDWPHPTGSTPAGRSATDVSPLLQIDDGRVLNQLPVWVPDPATRRTILVENPARLYGF
jgi:predicted TIM-barrel fold metal-dependent hydrolase